jgi:hypothetical protein
MWTVRNGEPIRRSVGPMTGTIGLAVPQFCKQRPGDLAALESATVLAGCLQRRLSQESGPAIETLT